MFTKFFGVTNRNKFLNELEKVLREKFPDKKDVDEIINSIGQANGIASLDGSGKVPSEQLPSYVDDIIEVEDYAHLPEIGETGKIYVTIDTGNQYRWGGSEYVPLNENSVQGIGIKKIIKLTQAEYDALSEKDNEAIYITNAPQALANGVYILYTDGSLSNYDTLDAGKIPVGPILKTDNVCFVIHPSEGSDKKWQVSPFSVIDGVTAANNEENALLDYSGASNTLSAINSGVVGNLFSWVIDTVYADGRIGYIPSVGESRDIWANKNNINIALSLISGSPISGSLWTSTQGTTNSSAYTYDFGANHYPNKVAKDNTYCCRSVSTYTPPLVYKIYQGSNLIASSEDINRINNLEDEVTELKSTTNNKADKVSSPTAGHLVKVNASGGLLDAGLAIVKMNKAEYDALVTKDANTVYLIDASPITSNGVYIAYSDGSYSAYDTLDVGKTAIGVALKTNNVSLLLHPSEGSNKIWSNNTPFVIEGVTTATDAVTALLDYAGKPNTAAAIASGFADSAFTFATDFGADWYLPACGEMEEIRLNATNINTALGLISGTALNMHNNYYWCSTQYDGNYAWNLANESWSRNYKGTNDKCRAVKKLTIEVTYKFYLGSVLIADSNTINDIASILATI